MKDQSELEAHIQEWLAEIKPVPPRDPQAAARGRAKFLGQAVSVSEFQRHKGWNSIFRKDRLAMNMLVSILVIAGLLFGGGATVNAARNDLPNEPLYAVKMWSEDLSLQFRNDPEQKVERLMDLAEVRVQEMTRLADGGEKVPDAVRQRLQQHIQQAIQICAAMDDPAMDRTLLQIRDRLQEQDRDMEKLQIHAQPVLDQTSTMLRQRLQLVDEGLLNHEMFRYSVRNGFRFGQEQASTPPPQNGPQNGQPTTVPASPNTGSGGPNPEPTGERYGPGEPDQDPGGPHMSATPSSTSGGGGMGGSGTGGEGSGGGGTGGNDSGGSGTGGMNGGGTGPGGGGGGGGSGSGGQGGKP